MSPHRAGDRPLRLGGRRGRGCGRRRSSGGGRGGRRGRGSFTTTGLEHDEHLTDRNRFTDLEAELADLAGFGRADGDGGLVRHHLDHFLILGDVIAGLHQPVDDFTLCNAFADIRQF